MYESTVALFNLRCHP